MNTSRGDPDAGFRVHTDATEVAARGEWKLPAPQETSMSTTTLTRPREGKVIAGVCAGIAQRYGWDTNVVRLLFVLSCLLPGPQFVVYVALWVLMPKQPY
jgi:phage shock protein PspC (stress-responsive transcriptional regulator)